MILRSTDIARADDERPFRRDGTCYYCFAAIGSPHNAGCVCLAKSVVVRMTIDVVVDVPRDWSDETTAFHFNGSSWCADNLLRDLGEWAEKEEQNCGCGCKAAEFELLRDATDEDHRELPLLIAERDLEAADD